MGGDVGEIEFRVENAELSRRLGELNQLVSELEADIERIDSSVKSRDVPEVAMEFNEGIMASVKRIEVFDSNRAMVYIDIVGTSFEHKKLF